MTVIHQGTGKIRILCLHGKGTNAAIMRSQTRPFASRLSSLCEFVYVDAPLPSAPYPGADQFFDGPFYSWYDAASMTSLRKAEERVLEIAELLGPFDGIMGFSQGCALASVIAKKHCNPKNRIGGRQPFKFAIFLCGGIPMGMNAKEITSWGSDSDSGRTSPNSDVDSESSVAPARIRRGRARSGSVAAKLGWKQRSALIDIPTVHVVGKHDSIIERSLELYRSCNPAQAQLYEHSAGHSIPRTTLTTKAIEKMIRKTIETMI